MDSISTLDEFSESSHPLSTPLDVNNSEESVIILHYQPEILKGRDGERLWKASNSRTCIDFCKLQLKVIYLFQDSKLIYSGCLERLSVCF